MIFEKIWGVKFRGKFGGNFAGFFFGQNKGSNILGKCSEHFREKIRASRKLGRANFVLQMCHPKEVIHVVAELSSKLMLIPRENLYPQRRIVCQFLMKLSLRLHLIHLAGCLRPEKMPAFIDFGSNSD